MAACRVIVLQGRDGFIILALHSLRNSFYTEGSVDKPWGYRHLYTVICCRGDCAIYQIFS